MEQGKGSELESLIENYINVKVKELKNSVKKAEEAAQLKVNAEFIDYLKDNCFTSD